MRSIFQISSVLILGFLVFPFIISCTSHQEKSNQRIEALEKELFGDSAMKFVDKTKARALIEAYIDHSKEFSEDKKTAEYIFKAAELANGIHLPVEALEYYNLVCEKYPASEKAPISLFLQGFLYENQLKNFEKAKTFYNAFLQKYPKHALVKDVQFSLAHLGMSDEELIKMFEEKNKSAPVN